MIFINFQPFYKQIKVLTKFHNFKPQEMKKQKFGRRVSPSTPLWPPRVTPGPPRSDPGSTPKLACASVFWPQRPLSLGFTTLSFDFCRLYWCCIDTVSILYRYCIDIVSIQYRYSVKKSKDRVTKPMDRGLWGRKTEGQGGFGVDLGSL